MLYQRQGVRHRHHTVHRLQHVAAQEVHWTVTGSVQWVRRRRLIAWLTQLTKPNWSSVFNEVEKKTKNDLFHMQSTLTNIVFFSSVNN